MVLRGYFRFIIMGEFFDVRVQDQTIRALFFNVQADLGNNDEGLTTVCLVDFWIRNIFELGPRRPRRIHNIW